MSRSSAAGWHLLRPAATRSRPPNARRLLPHLQVLTDRPDWLGMRGGRATREDWMALQALMGSCATICNCLLFMLSYQMPRPGGGRGEVGQV